MQFFTQDEFDEVMLREQRIPLEPCDSRIEDTFLWEYKKVANSEIELHRQQECPTRAAYRLDFMLSNLTTGRNVGIECDGRQYHNPERDSRRDAAIVSTGIVSVIYRLRGKDINFRIHDAFHLLSILEPNLFSKRGLTQIETLCRPLDLRDDSFGEFDQFFPHSAVRGYRQPVDDGYDGYEDFLEDRPMFATHINWTGKAARRLVEVYHN